METTTDTTFDLLLSNQRYTLDDAAALFDLDLNQVCRAALSGELPARVIDHRIIDLRRSDLVEWLERRDAPVAAKTRRRPIDAGSDPTCVGHFIRLSD